MECQQVMERKRGQGKVKRRRERNCLVPRPPLTAFFAAAFLPQLQKKSEGRPGYDDKGGAGKVWAVKGTRL